MLSLFKPNIPRWRVVVGIGALAATHIAALLVLFNTEQDHVARLAFLFFWALLNFFWIALLKRSGPAAAISLAMLLLLITLSHFKYTALSMTVTFTDVMMIDIATIRYLWTVIPDIGMHLSIVGAGGLILFGVLWLVSPFRVRVRTAILGFALSTVLLLTVSFAIPLDREDEFRANNYVSKFARSAVVALYDVVVHGILESAPAVAEPLSAQADAQCGAPSKLPTILMILDESGFDATLMPDTKVPPDYRSYFRSFDGKERRLLVEGVSGPSWFTEYNVLSGLSVRSYGRFAQIVPRIASGRVERGLPLALRRCGYRSYSIYPVNGVFLSARNYHLTAGFDEVFDSVALGAQKGSLVYGRQMDAFYYDFALRQLRYDQSNEPTFWFIYTTANHYPWNFRLRADLYPEWSATGNRFEVDEFLRRQWIGAQQYRWLIDRLKKEFPTRPFLIVRFGDHQPLFARHLIEPSLGERGVAERVREYDARYLTTYYTIDAVNFTPVGLSSALDPLDAPYLPIVVMEAAGLVLDHTFAEQKKVLQRCSGLFYACNDGAEARRFNRLLIDAGLIKGL